MPRVPETGLARLTPTRHDAATVTTPKTSLTGIKPTATPHLGNYLGAIRPALRLADRYRTIYFIADYHALTTLRDPQALQGYIYDVAATWLASGLDPDKTIFFRQSQVIEVFELAWILSCLFGTGQLLRGHSYKDAIAKGQKDPNAGITFYPMLMAADILLYDTHVVPVGKDQKQHLEVARDVAGRFNHHFGETLVVPEPLISDAPLVPGTDGTKMSKSKGNAIPLFAPPKQLRKLIMSIKTGSEGLDDPKDPDTSTVWQLCQQLAPQAAVPMAEKLRQGVGYGWGHAKQDFFEALEAELAPMRERFEALRQDEAQLDETLAMGAAKARAIAQTTMGRVREAVGIRRPLNSEKATVQLKKR